MLAGPARSCAVCQAARCSCGPGTSHLSIIDLPATKEAPVGKLKTYDVTIDGNRTSMKLTEDEAKRLGVSETKKASPAAAPNKKRTTATKTSSSKRTTKSES